jgi:hypothetical protein
LVLVKLNLELVQGSFPKPLATINQGTVTV